MQDLIQNYVSDLHNLREVFHKELEVTAEELSKAMTLYAKRCDAALESFMEKASARESELESSAAARLSQFCGVPANGGRTDVDNGPPAGLSIALWMRGSRPPRSHGTRIVSHVESCIERDRRPQPARSAELLLNQGRLLQRISPRLQPRTEKRR